MTKVYKILPFSKWQRKSNLSDKELLTAIEEMKNGLIDASLGGYLYKKMVKKPGMGKSGGYRTIIAGNKDGRWFFLHGFSKNELENLDINTLKALKEFASDLLYKFNLKELLSENQLVELIS